MSVRSDTADAIRTAWATIPALANIPIEATERNVDIPQNMCAIIRMEKITPYDKAPQAFRTMKMKLLIVSGYQDADMGLDELDNVIDDVLNFMDKTFIHDDAEMGTLSDNGGMAYVIPFDVIASK